MTNIASCPTSEAIRQRDGTHLQLSCNGSSLLRTPVDVVDPAIELSCVYYFSHLTGNLVSYGRLVDHGCLLGQSNEHHAVLNNGSVVFYGTLKNHVMVVNRTMNARYSCDLGDVAVSAVATIEFGQTVQKG